jgi:hypothetical protein
MTLSLNPKITTYDRFPQSKNNTIHHFVTLAFRFLTFSHPPLPLREYRCLASRLNASAGHNP